ncbi:MAG: hypothetical protein ACRCYO_00940 [Bacteroidia bacterium]
MKKLGLMLAFTAFFAIAASAQDDKKVVKKPEAKPAPAQTTKDAPANTVSAPDDKPKTVAAPRKKMVANKRAVKAKAAPKNDKPQLNESK